MRKAVFLDRDGILNEPVVRGGRPFPPERSSDVMICDGAEAALLALRAEGYMLICVTNQPDISRGTALTADLKAINERLMAMLPLDDIIVCPHDDADRCDCRKPKPGLLLEGARRHGVDLTASYLVGDRWRDIEAGVAAHCRTVLVDRDYAERASAVPPHARVTGVAEAATWIIADHHARRTMHLAVTSPFATSVAGLRVKLFADGADLEGLARLAADPRIAGFTTNPTLMRKAGVTDYVGFGKSVLDIVGHRPISFEVFADESREMIRQARLLASWGENVYVKIPVTNTGGLSTETVVRELTAEGIRLNVTALMTEAQVDAVCSSLVGTNGAYVSVFAGRIADTGRDPIPMMTANASRCSAVPKVELIWASPRELLNVFQADAAGVHVVTATHDILAKLELVGMDLDAYSLDTVTMFHRDANAAGFAL